MVLESNKRIMNSRFLISGWGSMEADGGMVRYLQQAQMPVVSNEKCNVKNEVNIGIKVGICTVICR